MRESTFKRGMALFVKSFPDKETDYDVMWEFLRDLDDRDFLKAISKLVMTTKDINRATNLIALIRDHAIPEDVSAGEAWGDVLKQISSIGSYGQPNFKDPLTAKVVACIGWRNLCLSENIAIERAHFLKIYETLAKRNRIDALTISHDTKKLIDDVVSKIGNHEKIPT